MIEVYPIGTRVFINDSGNVVGNITHIHVSGKPEYVLYCVQWWDDGSLCEVNVQEYQMSVLDTGTPKVQIGFLKPDMVPDDGPKPAYA